MSVDVRGITTGLASTAAERILPGIMDRDGLMYADTDVLAAALADAFVEGARFAHSELLAQLIEAGVNVRADVQIVPADGDG
jgi:hypothetical protein